MSHASISTTRDLGLQVQAKEKEEDGVIICAAR
jgi:hypothetical protein